MIFPAFLVAQTVTLPSEKIVYPHNVFWHKTEVHEMFNQGKGPWGVGLDFIARTRDELQDGDRFGTLYRVKFRPWINYQFNERARFSLSPIALMRTVEYVGKPEDIPRVPYKEWRTTFQFYHHSYSVGKKFMHTYRHRYELRWQERQNDLGTYRFFMRYRIRYRLRYMINKDSFYKDRVWYGMFSNELGINIGQNVVMNTFNQNRLYVGIGHRFANTIRAELRYVDRFRARGSTGFEFDHAKGPMFALFVDQVSGISFRKDKLPPVRLFD
jgi:hypothetical protein